jgi:hypothetical protein
MPGRYWIRHLAQLLVKLRIHSRVFVYSCTNPYRVTSALDALQRVKLRSQCS